MATDCSATTCCAVFTNPEATCIAAVLISGSDAIFTARACTAAARSSSDFCSSGDGLNETESLVTVGDLAGGALVDGCCERAAEVAASPISRTSKSAMRFIVQFRKEFRSSRGRSEGYPTIARRVSGRNIQFAGQRFFGVIQMLGYVVELREAVNEATSVLAGMSDEASRLRPGPGKWCPREILGHLIDSASNNHQRFVRAQFQDDLVFPGYEQDRWVSVQHYRDAPWDELFALWRNFNLHIARVMDLVPKDERVRPRARHNLDELAWQPIPREQPATLDYFMSDYVTHLKHHLAQIGIERS
jgi:hypothetical protein